MKFVTAFAVASAVLAPLAGTAAAQAAPGSTYHVVKTIKLGGDGGWDYLTADAAGHRLYISRGTHVMVLDTDKDSVIGDIANTAGVHGIALARDLNRGFTSNGRDSSVTVFDLTTLAPITVVHGTGRNPDAILYDPATKRVFTFNGGSGTATAIDAQTGTIVGTVELGGKPETGQADGRGHIAVNIEDKSNVVIFDSKSLAVLGTYPLAPCEEPSGMAMDAKTSRLFIGCSNKLMAVMDAMTGRVITTLPIGQGVDADGFDPMNSLAFASNGDGTLTVVHEDSPEKFSVVTNVPTMRRARTMTIDARTGRIYTVTAEFGTAPAATTDNPRPRPPMVPGSFTLLVLER
jgi:DNA-binding beta-propeller fold protein YncE